MTETKLPDYNKQLEIVEQIHSCMRLGKDAQAVSVLNAAIATATQQQIDHTIDVRNEADLETAFNKFIKKWCGKWYSHLIDSDENDGQYIRDKIATATQQAVDDLLLQKTLVAIAEGCKFLEVTSIGKIIVKPIRKIPNGSEYKTVILNEALKKGSGANK